MLCKDCVHFESTESSTPTCRHHHHQPQPIYIPSCDQTHTKKQHKIASKKKKQKPIKRKTLTSRNTESFPDCNNTHICFACFQCLVFAFAFEKKKINLDFAWFVCRTTQKPCKSAESALKISHAQTRDDLFSVLGVLQCTLKTRICSMRWVFLHQARSLFECERRTNSARRSARLEATIRQVRFEWNGRSLTSIFNRIKSGISIIQFFYRCRS